MGHQLLGVDTLRLMLHSAKMQRWGRGVKIAVWACRAVPGGRGGELCTGSGTAVLGSAVRCRPSAVDFAVNGDSGCG